MRRALDWLAGLSRRLPMWTGVLLIAPELWSIRLALVFQVKA
jgi:cytochrome c-type biogenesis protein